MKKLAGNFYFLCFTVCKSWIFVGNHLSILSEEVTGTLHLSIYLFIFIYSVL
jgi:hypothetical protein